MSVCTQESDPGFGHMRPGMEGAGMKGRGMHHGRGPAAGMYVPDCFSRSFLCLSQGLSQEEYNSPGVVMTHLHNSRNALFMWLATAGTLT